MRYDPKNAKPPLIADGIYEAEIVNAEEKRSKQGNDMLQVTYTVFVGSTQRILDDYFVNDNPSGLTRLKKLCAAIGHDFEGGEVGPGDVMGKSLKLKIKTQKSKDPQYDDKNVAAGYMGINDEVQSETPAEVVTGGHGDNIPF